MRVYQAGFTSVVALMGAALSQQQTDLLAGRFSEIVLVLDGDPAGREGTRDAASRLIGHSSVQRIMLAPGRQPDEMSSEEIGQALRDVSYEQKAVYTKSLTSPLILKSRRQNGSFPRRGSNRAR